MKIYIYYILCIFILFLSMGCVTDYEKKYPKSKVEIYFEEAETATLNQQYNRAAEKQLAAIKEQEKINKNIDQRGSYLYLGQIYFAQGKFNEAAKIIVTSIKGDIYLAQGKYEEAFKVYESAAAFADKRSEEEPLSNRGRARRTMSPQWYKIYHIYPYYGNYYIQLGEYENAIKYCRENLDICIELRVQHMHITRSQNRLAMAYFYSGDDAAAENLFSEAAGLNADALVVFPEDLAISLTMLGWIAEHKKENDKALTFYKDALMALKEAVKGEFWGIYRVEQADVLNRMGRFHVNRNNPAEAKKEYREAIQLRQATATTNHPNYADALKGMADIAAMQGDLTSATIQAENSLRILDTALVPTHPRISPTLVALSSLYTINGEIDHSQQLYSRMETILQKPLGPWKEDFLKTAEFYSELLKKAGKTDAAARLDQLRMRQKDKR
jgi:tetratricopeptide (TPR) repeat protein